jgi:hypothetical protein
MLPSARVQTYAPGEELPHRPTRVVDLLTHIYRHIYRPLSYGRDMQLRTAHEPTGTELSLGYTAVLAAVGRMTGELQVAIDAARRCGPQRERTMLVDLHNRVRGIAACLNGALAEGLLVEDSR